MGIRAAWEESLQREGHVRDPAQETVVAILGKLQTTLTGAKTPGNPLLTRFWRRRARGARGLYIWGGVGRGKTFLMDLFFETLEVEKKKRIHFHRMMRDVHARLNTLGDIEDPLDSVADQIAGQAHVLCFDEFFVSDIGDAMILGRLLRGLFDRGVTLVTTSNSPPPDLYKDGLQRSRFLPAIKALETHTRVLRLDGGTDYRLRLLQEAGTYLTPDDEQAQARLLRLFDESASSQIDVEQAIEINGRDIQTRHCAKSIAWFDFYDICDGPRSQSDYIEIARWYPEIIVSGVPVFDRALEDQARRFIALVDEFYDRRVKLIVSAARDAAGLYRGERLAFEFDRTVSRLVEMQSNEYLALPHRA
ncbi:MAG: cell division protein ZapE [Woeseiaceae bacterium]